MTDPGGSAFEAVGTVVVGADIDVVAGADRVGGIVDVEAATGRPVPGASPPAQAARSVKAAAAAAAGALTSAP